MPPRQLLTARGLAALRIGAWANDARPRGAGQLQARKLSSGEVAWYYRYTDSMGKQDRVPLGTALTLAQARDQAAVLSARYQAGERDLRRALEVERAPKTIEVVPSLGDLLQAYVDALRTAGKVSADAIGKSLTKHVEKPWPGLWSSAARSVGFEDLLPVIARMVEANTLREAGKVRSYLRAAYAAAISARQNPAAPSVLRNMRLSSNPARDLATVEGSSNTRERALSLGELRAYWRRIACMDGADGAALRFHLLTGGQRVAQLARLQTPDMDDDTGTVRILDRKGRRKKPRVHLVPLLAAARAAIQTMQGDARGPFLFTLNEGIDPIGHGALCRAMAPVVEAMLQAEETAARFTPGDLRRTIETRLAAAGQSDETRGQLQSHGLGGVQNRHYNMHRYDAEKLAALEALYALLTAEPATVTSIRTSLTA